MCGIFGFVAKGRGKVNVDWLAAIAAETQTRGHHAFGLSWLEGDGTAKRIRNFKRPGAFTDRPGDLGRVANSRLIIGHCRWATHGSPLDNRNNHPHPVTGGGSLVHNGVVRNYSWMARHFAVSMATECDSEVLALAMGKTDGSAAGRLAKVANRAEGLLAVLTILPPATGRKLYRYAVARRGNPLHYVLASEGVYFASLPTALGKRAETFPDYTAAEILPGERMSSVRLATRELVTT